MKSLNKEIYEINGKDTFVKIKANTFAIEKVLLSFVKFDTNGNKRIASGDHYLDFSTALALCHDILFCKIKKKADIERAKGQKYPASIFKNQGGKNEEKAKRTDKKALARIMELSPGNSQPYIFQYQEGPGHSDSKGLIIPDFGTKPEIRIIVPCSEEMLVELATLLQSHILSYITSQYVKDAYMIEYKTNESNTNTSNSKATEPISTPAQHTNSQGTTNQSACTKENSTAATNDYCEPPTQRTTTSPPQSTAEKKQKVMQIIFKSSFGHVDGWDNLKFATVKVVSMENRELNIFFEDENMEERKSEMLLAMKEKRPITIAYKIVKDGQQSFVYFVE